MSTTALRIIQEEIDREKDSSRGRGSLEVVRSLERLRTALESRIMNELVEVHPEELFKS